jgi:hypothetical protein
MWVWFPISRHVRVGVPWWLLPVFIPIAVVGWILWATVTLIRMVWRRPRPQRVTTRQDGVTVQITVQDDQKTRRRDFAR